MSQERTTPGPIIAKLREVEVHTAQRKTVDRAAEQVGATAGRYIGGRAGFAPDDRRHASSLRWAQTFSNARAYCSTSSGTSDVK
jgi:hypothetical protein